MKRHDLLRHLKKHGCRFDHEGGNHSIWINPANGRSTSVPRHREISEYMVREICKQLGIPAP